MASQSVTCGSCKKQISPEKPHHRVFRPEDEAAEPVFFHHNGCSRSALNSWRRQHKASIRYFSGTKDSREF